MRKGSPGKQQCLVPANALPVMIKSWERGNFHALEKCPDPEARFEGASPALYENGRII
jgi:hypothetical protein